MVTGLATALAARRRRDAFENVDPGPHATQAHPPRPRRGRPHRQRGGKRRHIAEPTCPNVAPFVTCRVPLGFDGRPSSERRTSTPTVPARRASSPTPPAAGVTLPDDDVARSAIATICQAVGGIPLAIELAAAQTAEVSLADLADRLTSDRLDDRARRDLIDGVIDSTIALARRRRARGVPATVADRWTGRPGGDRGDRGRRPLPRRRVVRILARSSNGPSSTSTATRPLDVRPASAAARAGRRALIIAEVRRQLNERLATAVFARLPPTATATPPVDDMVRGPAGGPRPVRRRIGR